MFQKGWNHQPGNHCRVWNKSFERIRTGQPLQPQLRPSFPMAWQAFITAWLSSVKSLRLRMFAVKRPSLVKIVCLYLQHDMYDMMLIMYTVPSIYGILSCSNTCRNMMKQMMHIFTKKTAALWCCRPEAPLAGAATMSRANARAKPAISTGTTQDHPNWTIINCI